MLYRRLNFAVNRLLFSVRGRSSVNSRSVDSLPNRGLRSSNDRQLKEAPVPGPVSEPALLRPFLFTVAFSGLCIAGGAIWEYEKLRASVIGVKKKMHRMFQDESEKYGELRSRLNQWWKNLSEGDKMFYGIFLLNSMVFIAWRVPRFQPFMVTHFCSNPFARSVCWPMVFSTFSHFSVLHFAANMYVLHSFSEPVTNFMGREQFLAFYLSAGVVSSMASHFIKALTLQQGLSLGASGAIMGLLAVFCSSYPDSRLAIAFIPNFDFSADTGLKAVLFIDFLGLALRWKFLDHAGHLGGALFGLFWHYWGHEHIWLERWLVIRAWHRVRKEFGK
nr:EOG090X07NR [Leptodora kindtii]